jgi:hypothetical protein
MCFLLSGFQCDARKVYRTMVAAILYGTGNIIGLS